MDTFGDYQVIAAKVPVALKNNRDRIDLPVVGLQQEAGRLGSLLSAAFASGKFHLTVEQSNDAKDRMADILWCIARLCEETGIPMQDVAAHSANQLKNRAGESDQGK
jgi:hypothetical protein